MNRLFDHIENYSKDLTAKYSPYTNVVGLARSVLALGTLLTLLVNPMHYLINQSIEGHYYNPLISLENFPMNKFNFFLILGVENAYIMKWIGILILATVISGYFMKITSILHWWVAISFLLSSSLMDGGDQMASVFSFLLIPICLSDPRKNHWDKIDIPSRPINVIGVLSIWIIRLQVAVIYLEAAVGKFAVTEWANGTALYFWLNHSFFGITDLWRPILNPLLSNGIMVSFLTYGVLTLELSLFLALPATNKYRKRLFPLAIFFHFSIIVFHGIFSFFFSVAAALILYLLPTYKNIDLKIWNRKFVTYGTRLERKVKGIQK